MDATGNRLLAMIARGPTGLASGTGSEGYHKPGRGCGNSIAALMDGFKLTGDVRYLDKAEELIRRCIHPNDDIESLDLVRNPEQRWYYTAFLQVLAKFIAFKQEAGTFDFMLQYAKASLLHYAEWMAANEVPFRTQLGKVQYPTETWIVMDMRKSNVFDAAAEYASGDARKVFEEKAAFFYETCLNDLKGFETSTFMRPLVMLMTYGPVHAYFGQNRPKPVESDCGSTCTDFGQPKAFITQKQRVKKRLLASGGALLVITIAVIIGLIN